MIRLITTGDRKLMLRVNRWEAPLWFRRWMLLATRGGDGWLWGTIGFVLLCFGGERRFMALEAGFVSVCIGLATFAILKQITGRERPREPHCWASLLPPDRFSFPSGHTITAFAVAMPLGLFYPSLMVGLVFCALSIGASRVMLGLHYLSDVLAGLAIGIAIGSVVFQYFA